MTIAENNSPLYGLVLAGGKSVRMGVDKTMMEWYGMPQKYYMAGLLRQVCAKIFISQQEQGESALDNCYEIIVDNPAGFGPMGGILSAFNRYPDVAWLVVAADLPLLDQKTLRYLISNRNMSCVATTFKSPHDGLPEPLITIWEPASYALLRDKMSEGGKCPRKVLINSATHMLTPPDATALMNANTPEDAAAVRQILASKNKQADAVLQQI
ncbi:MAG: NTP transferase domain-containing protein [Taibaiella sp.]|nr:NTP transferase domain-containing protein [Taibaiella sp.]